MAHKKIFNIYLLLDNSSSKSHFAKQLFKLSIPLYLEKSLKDTIHELLHEFDGLLKNKNSPFFLVDDP